MPLLLIGAGFWLSRSAWALWTVGVLVVVGGLGLWGLRLLRGRPATPAAVPALLSVSTTLTAFGALLTVRLVVLPDPSDGLAAATARKALDAALPALIQPLLVVAAVLGVVAALSGGAAGGRRARIRGIATGWRAMVVHPIRPVVVDPVTTAFPHTDRAGPDKAKRFHISARTGIAAAIALTAALFLAPLTPGLGGGTGGAALTFAGLATPEYAKLVLIGVLALLVARHSHQYRNFRFRGLRDVLRGVRRDGGRTRVTFWHQTRFVLAPLLLFSAVAVTSVLRSDFGTLIPVLAGTIGVTWAATAFNADHDTAGGSRLWRVALGYRVFLLLGAALSLITFLVAMATNVVVGERLRTWRDPWTFRWSAGCVPVEVRGPTPPAGAVACQTSLAADTESQHSQIAQSLSAIADGGLWGRGLLDRASGSLPAGSTDFVLAVVWSKLGGLVVLALALLMTLLPILLTRAVTPDAQRIAIAPSRAQLFAAGLGAMILGQFLFVLAATVNLVPHSGITAPLLSRGGQANLTLLLGLVVVLLLGTDQALRPPGDTGQRRPGVLTVLGVPAAGAVAAVAMVATVTAMPYLALRPASGFLPAAYDEHRPACPARPEGRAGLTSPPPDPVTCSTDRTAYNRTVVEVRLAGGTTVGQRRPSGTWELRGDRAGLVAADLNGLLRTPGGQSGLIDQAYADVLAGTAGTSLRRRLLPWPPASHADGGVELTVDPRLQHAAAAALRDAPDGGPPLLAGGVVVIEAATGRVLAAASTPVEPQVTDTAAPPVDRGEANRYISENPDYGELGPGGQLDGSGDERCADPAPQDRDNCWRWSYLQRPVADTARRAEELRRYVGGDQKADPPRPEINRALGGTYGLGSTFKVVIAAAFLAQGGHTAQSLLEAPDSVTLSSGQRIRNAGGGPCRNVQDGKVTLADALAYSCNTAFVRLAMRLSWPAVAAQAEKFGLRVGGCRDAGPWLAGRPLGKGAVATCVPARSVEAAIGNNALGGQDVQGNPLGLATVLAAVANDGVAVQPSLVVSSTDPATGVVTRTPRAEQRTALTPQQAAELRTALAGTAEHGTARGLDDTLSKGLYAKTGTHDVTPPGRFVRQHLWLTGFVDTPHGPVAFAVTVESRDQAPGTERVHLVVEQLLRALQEAK
ncbi:FtsW/RodA/SpoVE family cell cycle protein [Dactylosporangium aurantiacum]|uniref:FtsW/RodA/SpoVE family cell cycle protein n=1 Tax=Dactylosporangium aurantiacum TaxID=35754 RepID=A0A9Q9MJ16_9ACTN|nr:penicillin-binding transpeptidase domain-containing protein [Dactylosporangium aurantiacum]MDG6109364.1 penicillin-binding transpeptidase domain-containing protein [Dactylosporangium aurantiacum]UWZ56470.1 FtsW/RodA/SpoVE family cell cycle protein [Dactylosporangium aurantiacum]